MGKHSGLKEAYHRRKREIEGRLSDFNKLKSASEERLFEELCFCLLTPQSKAHVCDKIVSDLKEEGLLLSGTKEKLWPFLKKARFYRKKTDYLVLARKLRIKDKIKDGLPFQIRQGLVEHVKGMGYKEASHFLRNIGLGEGLAILDIHILRSLKELGVIEKIPKSMSEKKYLEIEEKVRKFSSKINIPMSHLDLLFWSMGTGKIFK